jgi:hypothetical protein
MCDTLHPAAALARTLEGENGELIAHVEFWVADGRLQSFEDRQRFRKASRELLARHQKGAP